MAIDVTLTVVQGRLQRVAREFAFDILQPLVRAADEDPDPQRACQAVKGAYVESYKLGFATGFIPKEYGGGGISNLDLQIVVEELTAVDPEFATILLVNGLALMPLVWFGSEAQKQNGSFRRRAMRGGNISRAGPSASLPALPEARRTSTDLHPIPLHRDQARARYPGFQRARRPWPTGRVRTA